MKTNIKSHKNLTHGGSEAADQLSPIQELKRATAACLLWEDNYYESGKANADRIKILTDNVSDIELSELAIYTRQNLNLRHVSLLLLSQLAKRKSANSIIKNTVEQVIVRPDELTEFLNLYWSDSKLYIYNQLKLGLGNKFLSFNDYELAKYNKKSSKIKLRDLLFLLRLKPKDKDQEEVFKLLANNELKSPPTWENQLSTGGDKNKVFTELLKNNKLGYVALLKNLKGMREANVNSDLIKKAILNIPDDNKLLPFDFINPNYKTNNYFLKELNTVFLKKSEKIKKFKGSTLVVVDLSGSMNARLSSKSTLTKVDAACSLSSIINVLSENCTIYATAGLSNYSNQHATKKVKSYNKGLLLANEIKSLNYELGYNGIFLTQCLNYIDNQENTKYDRVIVITDEQDCSNKEEDKPSNAPLLGKYNYMFNIGTYENSISNKNWINISGFSENVLLYIDEYENV